MKIIRSNKPLDDGFLRAIEKFLGFKFPKDYRTFLLCFNGGETEEKIFFFKNDIEDGSILDRLFGIVDEDYENLLLYIKKYKDRIPENCIPIAGDPGGNLVLLSIKMADRGKIYFWDHHREAPDGETPDYSNLTLIADSFQEFLDGLKAEPE